MTGHPRSDMPWQLAKKLNPHGEEHWWGTFETIGPLLEQQPKKGMFHPTPSNSLTFAGTGGDGLHLGLIEVDGTICDRIT